MKTPRKCLKTSYALKNPNLYSAWGHTHTRNQNSSSTWRANFKVANLNFDLWSLDDLDVNHKDGICKNVQQMWVLLGSAYLERRHLYAILLSVPLLAIGRIYQHHPPLLRSIVHPQFLGVWFYRSGGVGVRPEQDMLQYKKAKMFSGSSLRHLVRICNERGAFGPGQLKPPARFHSCRDDLKAGKDQEDQEVTGD